MNPPSMPYDGLCSLERLRALHERALRIGDPGAPGIIDQGCEEGTLGNAWMAASYDEIGQSEPQLVFGCYLLYYFATKQCFFEGNKRTAWLALGAVLETIGLEVEATDAEAIKFVFDVANKVVPDVGSVIKWVAERMRAISPPEVSAAVGGVTPQPQGAQPATTAPSATTAAPPVVSKSVTH